MRLAFATSFWFALACGRPSGGGAGAAPDPTTPVRVVVAASSDGRASLKATGTLVSERQVAVRAETTGLVQEVAFDHGQAVAAGQVLVRLSSAEPRAALAESEARVTLAEVQLDRTQKLFDRQNAAAADVDLARAEADLARAQRDRARESLRRTIVRAPFAGTTSLREVVAGDLLDPSRRITILVDPSALAVDLSLAERDLGAVAPGMEATVTSDAAPGASFLGHVSYVAPLVDDASRTFRVRVTLPDTGGVLRTGATAEVALTGSSAAALRIPTQAVLESARGAAVYVVGADGKAELRPVVTAERSADSVRVVEGLTEGDRIVIDGLVRLRPGATVRVLP